MAYQRKTIDMYELHIDYGMGLEHEVSEPSRLLINEVRKEYRDNVSHVIKNMKVKKVREPISQYSPQKLRDFENQSRQARQRWLERQRLKLTPA